jgi:AcrR family transcriptional regulator
MNVDDRRGRGRPRGFEEHEALDRAVHVFWEHGYEGASMSELTSAMGINKPSLYAVFGSKEELFRRALARYQDTYGAYAAAILEQPTAYAVIESYLRATVDAATSGGHPPGCLSIQGGLSCSPANSGICENGQGAIDQANQHGHHRPSSHRSPRFRSATGLFRW